MSAWFRRSPSRWRRSGPAPLKPEPAILRPPGRLHRGDPTGGRRPLAVNALLPAKMSAMFWVWRIDLLTLPFFVAGAVAIIFGVRVLWRQKLAVGYLFLAWPYPYQMILLRVLDGFTNADPCRDARDPEGGHVAKPAGSTRQHPVRDRPRWSLVPAQRRVRLFGREQRRRVPAGRIGVCGGRPGAHRAQGPLAGRGDAAAVGDQPGPHRVHLLGGQGPGESTSPSTSSTRSSDW